MPLCSSVSTQLPGARFSTIAPRRSVASPPCAAVTAKPRDLAAAIPAATGWPPATGRQAFSSTGTTLGTVTGGAGRTGRICAATPPTIMGAASRAIASAKPVRFMRTYPPAPGWYYIEGGARSGKVWIRTAGGGGDPKNDKTTPQQILEHFRAAMPLRGRSVVDRQAPHFD